MNKLNRKLLSGASLAALAIAVPNAADAAGLCPAPGGQVSTVCATTPIAVAVSTAGSGLVTVSNTGVIIASATNVVRSATGTVTATAVKVIATANPGGFATASVFNPAGNTIAAIAIDDNKSVSASANARAISEIATGTVAHNIVVNDGLISAHAVASAWGNFTVQADAFAEGIAQIAVGDTAGNTVVNNAGGVIAVDANAFVSDAFVGSAYATAVGIAQFAFGVTSAHNSIANAGTIAVAANAVAESGISGSVWDARASAHVTGLNQVAFATSQAHNVLVNSGKINVGANAFASGAFTATANAFVNLGINQSAIVSGGIGGTAGNFLSNAVGGSINIHATANAIAATDATAHAGNGFTGNFDGIAAIEQFANNTNEFGLAINTLVNAGLISIAFNAGAVATATDGFASASVTMDKGAIHQFAQAVSGSAVNNFINTGDIEIGGHAFASAWTSLHLSGGTAFAEVHMDPQINQHAIGVVATNNFANNGTIHVHGTATATAANWAFASANVSAIGQQATGFVAVNNLTNGTLGKIHVTANANAFGGTFVTAVAGAFGIAQIANGTVGTLAVNNLINDGLITVQANAFASAVWFGNATATASGVFQHASDALGVGNSFINGPGAQLNVGAHASAFGFSHASAHAVATGVFQSASSALVAANGVLNSGLINVHATAKEGSFGGTLTIFGFFNPVLASAHAIGISQHAGSAGLAVNAVTNLGVIDVLAHASASGAVAVASAQAVGIHQVASGAVTATNNVVNGLTANGGPAVISVVASAVGHGSHVTALAGIAFFSLAATGIRQNMAFATFGLDNVTNDGTLFVKANGSASGGFAGAIAAAIGIDQSDVLVAFDGQHVLNNGNITVEAKGFATGSSVALAGTGGAPVFAGGIFQRDFTALIATAQVTNNGLIDVHATATAHTPIFGFTAIANAQARGIVQQLIFNSSAAATVLNNATIAPSAHAFAEAGVFANAFAAAQGIAQTLVGAGVPLSLGVANVVNAGILDVTAVATAKAGDTAAATAFATGIRQNVAGYSVAAANVTNGAGATINVSAHAAAQGDDAFALAVATGVHQFASASIFGPASAALVNMTNSGLLNVHATALAHGGDNFAEAIALGVGQSAFAWSGALVESNHVMNATGALINVSAHAVATDANAGTAFAFARGVTQSAWSLLGPGLLALNAVTNNGGIHVSASAKGTGGLFGLASAVATGVSQGAFFAVIASDLVNNNGALTVNASAFAKTTADAFGVHAIAHASGIRQTAAATTFGLDVASVFNKGSINVAAKASAIGVSTGNHGFALTQSASATAHGISQNFFGAFSGLAVANVTNAGTINVNAHAFATGQSAAAWAFAQGVTIHSFTPLALGLNVVNSGQINVEADASGNGLGVAGAGGIFAAGSGLGVFGTIANFGQIHVVANVAGAAFGSARASGIGVVANSFTGLISNTGIIHVAAIGNSNEFVQATGIRVSSAGFGGGLGVGTIVNNSGTIWAGVSIDGGASYVRGTAINTSNAPNAMAILLEGSAHGTGHVYGNILLSTDDAVIVQNGKTCFNGVINQPYIAGTGSETEPGDARVFGAITTIKAYPLTAPFLPNLFTAAGGIDPYVAAVAIGHLTVASNGILDLVNDPRQGAAGAYVSTYFQAAGGELELEIRGIADGPGAANQGGDNTIGKIVAEDTATLGGKLEIIPYAGLYTNAAFRIVSAEHIAGTWTDGANVLTNSVLLKASVSNNGTIATLNLTRVHFDAVPGLTSNEEQAGDGLEGAYAALLANPTAHAAFASFVGKLFQVGGAAEYANDLQQLDGSQYGEQAEATLHSTRILNDTIGTHLQLTSDGGSDSVGQLISGVSPAAGGTGIGKGNIWVSAYGNRSTIDANSSDPSAKVNDRGIYIGVDFDMDQQSKMGFVAGHTTGDTNFAHDRNNAGLENHDVGHFNGWHLGAYGRYDAEPWYAQAILSYGTFTNDMTRNIFINPSSAGLCCSFPFTTGSSVIAGTAKSSYDSHTYSANGEVGYRLDTDSAYDLTPFLSLSYIHASSDAFHETGLTGANLAINDASSTSLDSQLGLRFSTDWQWTDHIAVTPIIRAAWEHDWDGTAWSVNESFWNAPAGSQFRINGGGNARDFASLGAGLGFKFSSKVEATINYEGRYSSSEKDNAILGHVNIHW